MFASGAWPGWTECLNPGAAVWAKEGNILARIAVFARIVPRLAVSLAAAKATSVELAARRN
jgi:hypothetical protein